MTAKQFEEYFFYQRWKETSTNTVIPFRFWLAAYIVQLFYSHFSLVSFSGLKYILARQILGCKVRHNARQSDNNTQHSHYTKNGLF